MNCRLCFALAAALAGCASRTPAESARIARAEEERLRETAQAALDSGRFDDARRDFVELARRRPRWDAAYLGLSAAFDGLGDSEEALRSLETGWQRVPDSEPIQVALARRYAREASTSTLAEPIVAGLERRRPGSPDVLELRRLLVAAGSSSAGGPSGPAPGLPPGVAAAASRGAAAVEREALAYADAPSAEAGVAAAVGAFLLDAGYPDAADRFIVKAIGRFGSDGFRELCGDAAYAVGRPADAVHAYQAALAAARDAGSRARLSAKLARAFRAAGRR